MSTEFLDSINKCLNDSFENPKNYYDFDNTILSHDSLLYPRNIVYTIPMITLNKNLLRESLKKDVLISAICEKLLTPPELCRNPKNIRIL